MYRNNVKNILSQVKISKNNEVNDFMKSFVYHNEKFFEKCLRLKMGNFRKLPFSIGIHYECGPDKWGSVECIGVIHAAGKYRGQNGGREQGEGDEYGQCNSE